MKSDFEIGRLMAMHNGVLSQTYQARVRSGMDPIDAGSKPVGTVKVGPKPSMTSKRAGWNEWTLARYNPPDGVTIHTFRRWLSEAEDISDEHKDGFLFKGVEV